MCSRECSEWSLKRLLVRLSVDTSVSQATASEDSVSTLLHVRCRTNAALPSPCVQDGVVCEPLHMSTSMQD